MQFAMHFYCHTQYNDTKSPVDNWQSRLSQSVTKQEDLVRRNNYKTMNNQMSFRVSCYCPKLIDFNRFDLLMSDLNLAPGFLRCDRLWSGSNAENLLILRAIISIISN